MLNICKYHIIPAIYRLEIFQQYTDYQTLILDAIREPLFFLSDEKRIMVWNKSAEELTGVDRKEVLGKDASEILQNGKDDFKARLNAEHAILTLVSIRGNSYRILLDPIVQEGKLLGYKGGIYDSSQGILKAFPRKYLEVVISKSPVSILVFDREGKVLYSNQAIYTNWGLNREQLDFFNTKYNIFLDKQLQRQGIMPSIKRAFDGKPASTLLRYEVPHNNGELQVYWLLAHLYPVLRPDGQVEFVVLHFLDVTEQKNLQEAYTSASEWIKLAIENKDLGTWEWHVQEGVLYFKDGSLASQQFNLSSPDDLTRASLMYQDDVPPLIEKLTDLVEGRTQIVEAEFRARDDDGNWPWFMARGRVVKCDEAGRPLRVAGIHVNIDERKQIEQRIKESEAKFKDLVDNAPIGIGIIADEKMAFVNKRLAEMGEVEDRAQVLGVNVRAFIPDEERYKIFMERYRMVTERGEKAPLYTTQLKTVKGNIFDVEVLSIPTIHEGKRAMQVLMLDITERKKTLQELARSRELHMQLFANAPMGIVLLDEQFNVNNINKGFEKLFGYKLDEIKGKSLMDFIVPPELAEEAERLNDITLKDNIEYFESYRLNKKKEKIPVLIYALPVKEGGQHFGIYGIYIDISKRVQAEEELKTRNLELDNFVYKVSHDLRAPLASVLGLINLSRLEQDNPSLDYIELIESQIYKLDNFIRDVLSHSKNLKMSLSVGRIDFQQIVDQCFKDLNYLPGASEVEVEVDINVQDFYSDRWRISEIFRNLIGNAIKYRNPEAEPSRIAIKIEKSKNNCLITIADNGLGIDKESLPHIMKMFYRASEKATGSGIGLYIVQKAVEIIKGRVEVTSKPGEGTTFTLTLPSLEHLYGTDEEVAC